MNGPFIALGVLVGGVFSSTLALAPGPSEDPLTSVAPYLGAGGTAAAVTALVYVVRKMLRGELVPLPLREQQMELAAALRATTEREVQLAELLATSHKMLAHLDQVVEQNTEALWSVQGPPSKRAPSKRATPTRR